MPDRSKSQSKLALFTAPHRQRRAAIRASATGIAEPLSDPKSGLTAAQLACCRDAFRRAQSAMAQIEAGAEQPAGDLAPHPEWLALPRRRLFCSLTEYQSALLRRTAIRNAPPNRSSSPINRMLTDANSIRS